MPRSRTQAQFVRTIHQSALLEYFLMKREIDRLEEQRRHLRERLLRLYEAGAKIDGGKFRLKVEYNERRPLNQKSITAAIGREEYRRLKSKIAVVEIPYLFVRANGEILQKGD